MENYSSDEELAIHTRFEHYLGTYNFASGLMNCILQNTRQIHIIDYLSKIKYFARLL